MKQYKNTVNTSTHITKTPTHYKPTPPTHTHTHTLQNPHITKPTYIHKHTHITKQVKTTTVHDTHQIK